MVLDLKGQKDNKHPALTELILNGRMSNPSDKSAKPLDP